MGAIHHSYAGFLAEDPRRIGDALELGHDWRGDGSRWRVCWYAATGELTAEGVADPAALEIEDFHAGITGPVHVLAVIRTQHELEARLGRWPSMDHARPRSLARLHQLIDA